MVTGCRRDDATFGVIIWCHLCCRSYSSVQLYIAMDITTSSHSCHHLIAASFIALILTKRYFLTHVFENILVPVSTTTCMSSIHYDVFHPPHPSLPAVASHRTRTSSYDSTSYYPTWQPPAFPQLPFEAVPDLVMQRRVLLRKVRSIGRTRPNARFCRGAFRLFTVAAALCGRVPVLLTGDARQ